MTRPRIHVVAAALVDDAGRILIQRRADAAHLGGLWEFPGGKLERGETRRSGLVRELREELGIEARTMTPLITIPHDYPDKRILLDVWSVYEWRGRVHGREGQPVEWVVPAELHRFSFPAADRPVLGALALPRTCLVTPPPGDDLEAWLDTLCLAGRSGVSLIQLRAPGMSDEAIVELSRVAGAKLHTVVPKARMVINGDLQVALAAGAHGVHLNSRRLWEMAGRSGELPEAFLMGASCHDAADLERAGALGLDYALLGPVCPTLSHPDAVPLGWDVFADLVSQAKLPVYGLGGLAPADVLEARIRGGQGIAAIRGLWPG